MATRKTKAGAVFTGDIVNSSALKATEKRKMLKTLDSLFRKENGLIPDLKTEVFQGDSFQGITTLGVGQSLRYAMAIIAGLKKHNMAVRISIGIGTVDFSARNVITSNGTAFQYSGRGLEALKKNTGAYISLSTYNDELNREFEVHCATLDYLIARCTPLQAEALQLALDNLTQMQIAILLKLSQPTVQQRLQSAGWPVFKAIVNRFEQKIQNPA